jgi:hypothetical protein
MNTLYLGKLEYADPLYEILSSKVCPDVKDPIFHENFENSRRFWKSPEMLLIIYCNLCNQESV